ncbi:MULTISPECIES: RDD family protein [unclassified Janibacter]|uniref:RDD family protein n=1 Tax=unclassified Janibacter TaxID=2649294 RepID=UPI003D0866A5
MTPPPAHSGPTSHEATAGQHHGARLGLPASGTGSLATLGRRVPALVIDWFACQAIALGLLTRLIDVDPGARSFLPLAVFLVENVVLVALTGTTLGHRLLGMHVVAPHRPGVSWLQSLIRAVLLCLVIPAVVWDADGRGLHDRAAGTLLLRT